MEWKNVIFKKQENVAYITINDVEKRNALTLETADSLINCLNACSDDEEVRVIVLRGAQGNFCGGGDIKGMKHKVDTNTTETRPALRKNNALIKAILYNKKPVVAWLEGAVAGGGVSLALACDFTYAQEESLFTFAFVNIGFVPDMGSSFMLTKNLGAAKAKELMMLGSRFSGKEAQQWGIITQAVPKEKLEETIQKVIHKLAGGPTLAYERIKKLLNRNLYSGLECAMENEGEYQYELCKTNDHAEAIHSFFEKRKPTFIGK